MISLEETVHALARRVADLERDNAHLKAESARRRAVPALSGEPSRRGLLIGGAGIVGILAGGALTRPDRAAAAPAPALPEIAHHDQLTQPRIVGVRAVVPSEHGAGNHSARYIWDLAAHFTGDDAPVVVAVALDNYLFASAGAELT